MKKGAFWRLFLMCDIDFSRRVRGYSACKNGIFGPVHPAFCCKMRGLNINGGFSLFSVW
ncbi:hypothetical protein HMPREF0880_03056 [Yokenella regensburgei ATCC 43003]|nr:hypothetical protein HMPREF0880_03056 [Yokenella regensburgei ATCC 43003]